MTGLSGGPHRRSGQNGSSEKNSSSIPKNQFGAEQFVVRNFESLGYNDYNGKRYCDLQETPCNVRILILNFTFPSDLMEVLLCNCRDAQSYCSSSVRLLNQTKLFLVEMYHLYLYFVKADTKNLSFYAC